MTMAPPVSSSFEDVEGAAKVATPTEAATRGATQRDNIFQSLFRQANQMMSQWQLDLRSAKKELFGQPVAVATAGSPTTALAATADTAATTRAAGTDAAAAPAVAPEAALPVAPAAPAAPAALAALAAMPAAAEAPAYRSLTSQAATSPTAPPSPTAALPRLGPFEISDQLLGEGGYGRVVLARHVDTNQLVAVKTVVTDSPNSVRREIAAMRRAGAHEHLCTLNGYFEGNDHRTFSLVLELCAGGELYSRVERDGNIPEAEARRYFCGILAGVRHLHAQGIAHRDLKLENVLLGGPHQDTPKVCDLGLAHVYQRNADGSGYENPSLNQWCGSRSYCPPEVMARLAYDGFRADLWSLGVCLFAMVSGFFPVEEATQRDWRFSRIALLQLRGQGGTSTARLIYEFYERACPLSPTLVELLDAMLMIQPPRRLPLDRVAEAPWVVGEASTSASASGLPTPLPPPTGGADAAAAAQFDPFMEANAVEAIEPVHRSGNSGPPRLRRQRACSQQVGHEPEM